MACVVIALLQRSSLPSYSVLANWIDASMPSKLLFGRSGITWLNMSSVGSTSYTSHIAVTLARAIKICMIDESSPHSGSTKMIMTIEVFHTRSTRKSQTLVAFDT